jgi:N,N-dimethylformamidase
VLGNFGLSGGGAAGLELDAFNPSLGSPEWALVIASSEDHSNAFQRRHSTGRARPGLPGPQGDRAAAADRPRRWQSSLHTRGGAGGYASPSFTIR